MNRNRARPLPIHPAIEALEGRAMLCGSIPSAAPAAPVLSSAVESSVVLSAAKAVKKAPTQTTLAFSAATLGSPITFTVTVRAAAAAGVPTGTVNLIDHHKVLQSLTLTPTGSDLAKYYYSDAVYTLTQTSGGAPYFFGKHPITATFTPSGAFAKSSVTKSFTVSKPAYTALGDGVEYATIIAGSGAAITTGQTANALYTGILAKNGHIFDDSVNDGGTPLSYALGAGSVITGFDEGTVGMQVGETRLIYIPPAEGYGATTYGPIPGNSTLLFLVTLVSIT